MALNLKVSRRVARKTMKRAKGEAETTPKVISRKYLSPTEKSEVGVDVIRKAIKATKEAKSKAARAR